MSVARYAVPILYRLALLTYYTPNFRAHSPNCQLTTLNMSDNYLGNEEIILMSQVLPSMFSLTDLDISFNDVHAVGARHLANALKFNTTLKHLNLGGNHVQDAGSAEVREYMQRAKEEKQYLLLATSLIVAITAR